MNPEHTTRTAESGLREPDEPDHFENEDFDHQLSAIDPPGVESTP